MQHDVREARAFGTQFYNVLVIPDEGIPVNHEQPIEAALVILSQGSGIPIDELRKMNVEGWVPSENGVPTINNREELEKLYDIKNKKSPPLDERTILDEMLEKPRLRNYNSTIQEIREATIEQVRLIMSHKVITIEELHEFFDSPKVLNFIKKIGLLSPDLATLILVHLILYGKSVLALGTEKHLPLAKKANLLEVIGCLMMTEEGGGSDIAGTRTTAAFDNKTREFTINTPSRKATKAFIGGAAKNANRTVLFARLILNGKDYGVHGFEMEIRKNGELIPGMKVKDMGKKLGLNGVDNAYVTFENVRIPYDSLLDRYCEISKEGEYIAKEGNLDPLTLVTRFLLGQFVSGRHTIAYNSGNSFSFLTAVFGCYPPSISKFRHSKEMVDNLALSFAHEFAQPIYFGKNLKNHFNASVMKAVASQKAMEFFDKIINLYGRSSSPHHYAIVRELAEYQAGLDATRTYEGDNNVLLQFVAGKQILKLAYQEYLELTKLDFSLPSLQKKLAILWKYISQNLFTKELPYFLLKAKMLELQKSIANKMRASGGKPELVKRIWDTSCQEEGITIAKIHAETLIIKEFYKKAKALDEEEKSTKWMSLFEIYSWKICKSYIPHVQIPDLSRAYDELMPQALELLSRFDLKMEWLDAIIPKPSKSIPFDKFDNVAYELSMNLSCAL